MISIEEEHIDELLEVLQRVEDVQGWELLKIK